MPSTCVPSRLATAAAMASSSRRRQFRLFAAGGDETGFVRDDDKLGAISGGQF